MPVYRDDSGRIVEEKTVKVQDVRRPGGGTEPLDQPADYDSTRMLDPNEKTLDSRTTDTSPAGQSREDDHGDEATVRVSVTPKAPPKGAAKGAKVDAGDAKTQVFRKSSTQVDTAEPVAKEPDTAKQPDASETGPVTGWLAVVAGPGLGNSYVIGIGSNSVGRSSGNRIQIDHGDEHISRDSHCTITFDPRSGKYFLQSGSGVNLTYVGEAMEAVLTPHELEPYNTFVIGDTTLCFVPLHCDKFPRRYWE